MKIRIPEPSSWRPDGSHLFAFGEYRVPEDMSEEHAKRAIDEGAAVLVDGETSAPAKTSKPKAAAAKPST